MLSTLGEFPEQPCVPYHAVAGDDFRAPVASRPDKAAQEIDWGDDDDESEPDDPTLPPKWKRGSPPPRNEFVMYWWYRLRELCLVLTLSKRFEKFSMSVIILNTIDMCLQW